jgi:hypothetical protein
MLRNFLVQIKYFSAAVLGKKRNTHKKEYLMLLYRMNLLLFNP